MFDGNGHLLAPEQQQQGSSSRTPSPTPSSRLPITISPRQMGVPLPQIPRANGIPGRSRTPSPDKHALPHPPKMSSAPGRAVSPLGKNMRVPRPLPNPFSRADGSQQSLGSTLDPSRSGTGSTGDHGDDEDVPPSSKPSRKALGKRRAVVDEDSECFVSLLLEYGLTGGRSL